MIRDSLADAVLVVAHPDDEILWFSSVFQDVGRILITYLDAPGMDVWSRGRRAAMESFPMPNVEFLGLTESMTFKCANWSEPVPSEFGLQLNAPASEPRLSGCDPDQYVRNYHQLRTKLTSALKGVPVVITHNPWGEYGHEDHVQVYRAVTSLQTEMGYEVWFDNYVSDRSLKLMAQTLARTEYTYETLATRPEATREIEALYRRHDCWTWPFENYRWATTECLVRDTAVAATARHAGASLPLNYINVDQAELQTRRPSRIERLAQRYTRWKRSRRR